MIYVTQWAWQAWVAASRPSAIIPHHCILLYYCVQLHIILLSRDLLLCPMYTTIVLNCIVHYYCVTLQSTLLQPLVPNCILLYYYAQLHIILLYHCTQLHTTLLQSIVGQCILLYHHLQQHQPSSSSLSSTTLHTQHPHHHHCRHHHHHHHCHHHHCHHHQIRCCMLINGLQSLRWANLNCTAMNYSTNASSTFQNVPT